MLSNLLIEQEAGEVIAIDQRGLESFYLSISFAYMCRLYVFSRYSSRTLNFCRRRINAVIVLVVPVERGLNYSSCCEHTELKAAQICDKCIQAHTLLPSTLQD